MSYRTAIRTTSTILAVAAVMTSTLACTSSTDDPDEPTVEPTELPDTLSGIVYDENDDAVGDVSICVLDRDDIPCVTTDDMGQYDLALPHDEDLIVSYEKSGHVPKLRMYRSPGDAFRLWAFQRTAYYHEQMALVGVDWDESTALITTHPGQGVSLVLDAETGEGPFYMNEELDLDPELTETTPVGVGAFANVAPGTYAIAGVSSTADCVADAFRDANGTGEVLTLPGHITWVGFTCN